jgi:hypothetical protein
MRFRGWLVESSGIGDVGRSFPYPIEDFYETIKKECKSALAAYKVGKIMYRGLYKDDSAVFVQPSKFTRVSANTINLYTILIDNSRRWKSYPERSKSIICSSDYDTASSYGSDEPYIVFPKDGYKIGVCPKADMWHSFRTSDIDDLFDFNSGVKKFINDKLKIPVNKDDFLSYGKFKKLLDDADEAIRIVPDIMNQISSLSNSTFGLIKNNYKGDMLEMLEEMLDPGRNGFKVINDMHSLPTGNQELWTDADCYLTNFSGFLDKNIKEEK